MIEKAPRRRLEMTARRRVLPGLGLFVALFVVAGWLSAGSAQAAVTPFVLSPTSGPPGTVVHVGGTGCSPGVSLSATSDFVEVTATTLDLAIQTPGPRRPTRARFVHGALGRVARPERSPLCRSPPCA